MRNPFRRRRKSGENYVLIPEDQLPANLVEQLEGVTLYDSGDGEAPGVFVNIDGAEAEVEARSMALSQELAAQAIEQVGEGDLDDPEYRRRVEAVADADMASRRVQARLRKITESAFNNTDHWLLNGIDDMADDDTRYALLRIDLSTGRIGESRETEVFECPDCGAEFFSQQGYIQHYRLEHQ